MKVFILIILSISLGHYMAVSQEKLLSPEELKRQLENSLKQPSEIDSLYDSRDIELSIEWHQNNELVMPGMPQLLITPKALDQNRTLIQHLDGAMHNMPILDFGPDTILSRDP